VLVSSTEPKVFHELGTASTVPEKYGVDFLWRWDDGWHGVQRKTYSDLQASVGDGRLGKEVVQWAPLQSVAVILERSALYRDIPRNQWWAWQHALNCHAEIYMTDDPVDTLFLVNLLHAFTQPEYEHKSLRNTRDAVPVTRWGKAGSREYAIHLLCGLPGVGVELAGRIYDAFGGLPFTWVVHAYDTLLGIEGIGPKKADRIMAALYQEVTDAHSTQP
jgi:ERCC4-type nuclease